MNYEEIIKNDLEIEAIDEDDKKILIERYINHANFNIVNSLTDANIENGLLKASSIILYLEAICKANNKIPIDYEIKIKEYEEKYKNLKNSFYLIALKRLELIMSYFFDRKPIYSGLKLKNEPIEILKN